MRSFPLRSVAGATAGFATYLIVAHFTFGNRPEQFVLCSLMYAACVWSDRSRRFFRGMLPFVLFGIAFDCLKLIKPGLPGLDVQVSWPYLLDKALFGVGFGAARISLGEYFAIHHAPAIDFVCGLVYLLYVYLSTGLALYLVLAGGATKERLVIRYGWTFFFVNIAAYVTYMMFPVAPPWYVACHGLGPADLGARPSAAALIRWDQLTGVSCFATLYARGSDVFGSVPSLHCAYPMITFLYGRELRQPWLNAALLAFWATVVFSAVYLQHHYVLDTLLGTAYAFAGWRIERALTSETSLTTDNRAVANIVGGAV